MLTLCVAVDTGDIEKSSSTVRIRTGQPTGRVHGVADA